MTIQWDHEFRLKDILVTCKTCGRDLQLDLEEDEGHPKFSVSACSECKEQPYDTDLPAIHSLFSKTQR